MTSAKVFKTSDTTTDNSPSQKHTHSYDQTTLSQVNPRFKPFKYWIKTLIGRQHESTRTIERWRG